ncbi:unnamed protein product [Allacma fusca]|uniref:Uncharacterized protein n=1 Tax=Allacma fusca TaxID=39272 RepID=A0A8J2PBU8_9HEXA|nr:unnamed protein product [Allacma fusca]
MASQAMEVSSCKCVCQRSPGGECVCICDAPCAGKAEGKVMEWTCQCEGEGGNCRCKFRLRCNRQDGDDAPCGVKTDLYTCQCKCGEKPCTLQIRKCSCCEIVRVGCECDAEDCACEKELAPSRVTCCQKEGECCKN